MSGHIGPLRLVTFDQFSALMSLIISRYQPCQPWEEVMENLVELMQKLLEIQSGGRQRSPELIAEDERLMDRLQKRSLARKPTQTIKLSQDSPELGDPHEGEGAYSETDIVCPLSHLRRRQEQAL
jgi:hypothetical protein